MFSHHVSVVSDVDFFDFCSDIHPCYFLLFSITMHVTLDHYKQKKDEENLYSKCKFESIFMQHPPPSLPPSTTGDVNFITDQEDTTCE